MINTIKIYTLGHFRPIPFGTTTTIVIDKLDELIFNDHHHPRWTINEEIILYLKPQ